MMGKATTSLTESNKSLHQLYHVPSTSISCDVCVQPTSMGNTGVTVGVVALFTDSVTHTH